MSDTLHYLNDFRPHWYQQRVIDALLHGKKRVILLWSRRCLAQDTLITMADGSWKYIQDIQLGDKILSHNGTHFVEDTVKDIWNTGTKESICLSNQYYLPIISSQDHVFAVQKTSLDWKKAGDIKYDYLLQYALMPQGTQHNPDLAELIGYLQSDGYVSAYQQPKFTNNNKEILERVDTLATRYGMKVIWRPKGNGYDLGLSNGTQGGGTFENPIKKLFRDYGQDVPKYEQRVHPLLWTMDKPSVLRYFAAILSGDGSFSISSSKKPFGRAYAQSVRTVEIIIHCGKSHTYALDVYFLLRKIGIIAQRPKVERGSNWKIRIGKAWCVKELLACIPVYGKQDKALAFLEIVSKQRGKFKTYADACITRVKKTPGTPVTMYDIATKHNHNFVANGYLVHNSGKDLLALNIALLQALQERCIVIYLFPTQRQARDVVWSSMTIDNKPFLSYIPDFLIAKKNETRLEIHLKNGSIIALRGSNNPDSLRGLNAKMVILSEYADHDPVCWQQVLQPVLRANNGIAIFISTPKGMGNHYYALCELAKNDDRWFFDKKTIEDTGHISPAEIERDIAQGLISREVAMQEYYCSFERGQQGIVFSGELHRMRQEDRITYVPYEDGHPVHTAWDLGWDDETAIIFFQLIGQSLRIIDYYENRQQTLAHYAQIIYGKGYTYGKHFLPHDVKQASLQTGTTREDTLYDLGIQVERVPLKRVVDRLEDGRQAFAKAWIDEKKCERLVHCLDQYHREWNEKLGKYNEMPIHNFASHGADAWTYMAVAVKEGYVHKGMTQDDINALKMKAKYGSTNEFDIPKLTNPHLRY